MSNPQEEQETRYEDRIAELEAENTRLKWINNHQLFQIEKLREALEEIAESDELASHIAKQALEKE